MLELTNYSIPFFHSNVEQVEFILSGDHHYVSTKPMPIPSEEVTYEEISYEPKAKKRKWKYRLYDQISKIVF